MRILSVVGRTIYDSRGQPTVECDLVTELGKYRAAVPSGASTGIHEAHELRDGGQKWNGKGVTKAVASINEVIGPAVEGTDATQQASIDQKLIDLDGTSDKSKLGANAILGVSMAVCRAGAAAEKLPLYQHIANIAGKSKLVLPVPCLNVINGGVHAGNELAFQEFMIMPVGASSFKEAMMMATETYAQLKTLIKAKYGLGAANVGDEGGFAPPLNSADQALDLLTSAIEEAGFKDKVHIAFDSASSEFFDESSGTYNLSFKSDDKDARKCSRDQMQELYMSYLKKYDILLVEDPFAEDDWAPCAQLTSKVDVEVVGDDMFCTNPIRIKKGIAEKAANAILLKVNQIGTVTESIEAVSLAKDAKWGVFTSHRSGETTDDFIADLTVGLATGHVKSGACCRGERLAKYNQLLRIEEELGDKAQYAGKSFRYIPWEK